MVRSHRGVRWAIATTFLLASGCAEDRWIAIVYPDASNLSAYELAGEYADLETCRTAAVVWLRSINAEVSGEYECGLNCEREEAIDGWLCEETAD